MPLAWAGLPQWGQFMVSLLGVAKTKPLGFKRNRGVIALRAWRDRSQYLGERSPLTRARRSFCDPRSALCFQTLDSLLITGLKPFECYWLGCPSPHLFHQYATLLAAMSRGWQKYFWVGWNPTPRAVCASPGGFRRCSDSRSVWSIGGFHKCSPRCDRDPWRGTCRSQSVGG